MAAPTTAEQTLCRAQAGWLKAAVEALRAAGIEVVAPVADGDDAVSLAPVASADAMALDALNALVPLKRLFFPATEVLLEFEKHGDGDVDVEPEPLPDAERVVMGCRPCDAASLDILDQVFQWDYDDLRYRAERERTTVVTFACTAPDPSCFCSAVGGSPHGERGSDALVFPQDDGGALIKVLTAKGEKLAGRLADLVSPVDSAVALPPTPAGPAAFDPEKVKAWLDENFESDLWPRAGLRCLGCGACSYLCPTCHCFDIVDEGMWDRGERRRNWDCCSFALFTAHASGHNPRADQAARYRQRVMHKFKYFPERFGRVACVGCGRCIRACGVGQNLVSLLTDIEARGNGASQEP